METSFAWLEIFLNASFWVAAVRIATPLIFGTLGEVICERAGVLNLGIEGWRGAALRFLRHMDFC